MERIGPPRASGEEIEALLYQHREDEVRAIVSDMHPVDIADLLDELPVLTSVAVFEMLPLDIASEVLDETGSLVRQELVAKVDDERLADLLDELPMDDAAEFLEDLPDPTANRLLTLMEPDEAEDVRELLRYEEESAGRLMSTDVAVLRRQWTVSATFSFLQSLTEAETLHYLYVVDRNSFLIGVVPIRSLVLASPEETIENIMLKDVVSVTVTADQEEMAELVSRYDYVAIPVVDQDGRLLGVVTVDDVLDVVAEEATEDIQRLGGSEPLEQPYFANTALQLARKRAIWLILLFFASFLTDLVINQFRGLLPATMLATLILFLPVITGTGGNAGSQTVATVIRAMAVGEVRLVDVSKVLRKELVAAILIGLILGILGYLRALAFNLAWQFSLILAITLPLVVLLSNSLATIVPLAAEKARIDPTVISTPMITTIVDATGILIYLGLALIIFSF